MSTPAATPRVRDLLVDVVGAALVVAWFLTLVLPRWPDPLPWPYDEDAGLHRVLRTIEEGNPLLPGHKVLPTPIELGPLFDDVWAVGHLVSGGDPWGSWLFLVVVDLVGLLSGLILLRPALGRAGAWLVTLVLLGDPEYYADQASPFWYQYHSWAWLVPAAAGLSAFLGGHGARWWWLGVGFAVLAAQLHGMMWTLLPVVVLVTLLGARSLGRRDVAVGAAIAAVVGWPYLRQLPVILDPASWRPAFADGGRDRVEVLLELAGLLPLRVAGGAPVLVVAVGLALVRLVRGPRDGWWGASVVGVAWLVSFGAVTWAVAPRWTYVYGFSAWIPASLLVAHAVHAVASLAPRPAWVVAPAGLLLAAHGAASMPWSGGAPASLLPCQDRKGVDAAVEWLRGTGIVRADVPRLHGLPCTWKDVFVCPSTSLPLRLPDAPTSLRPDEDVRLRWSRAGYAVVERGLACATARDDGDVLIVDDRCAGGTLYLVLAVRPIEAESVRAAVEAGGGLVSGAWPSVGEPEPVGLGVVLATLPVGGAGERRLVVPGAILQDAWVDDRVWSVVELGLVRAGGPGYCEH